jgi:hypothetical protein
MKRTNDFRYLKTEKGYVIYDCVTNMVFGCECKKEKAIKMVDNLNNLRRNFILNNK